MRVPNSTPIVCGQLAMTEINEWRHINDRLSHLQIIHMQKWNYANIVNWLTFFLGEMVEKARFTDAHITDYDVFENVIVIIRSARHRENCWE